MRKVCYINIWKKSCFFSGFVEFCHICYFQSPTYVNLIFFSHQMNINLNEIIFPYCVKYNLLRIFLYSNWIRKSENLRIKPKYGKKYGLENLCIRALFTPPIMLNMLNVMSLFRSNNKNICLVSFMLILDTFHRGVLRSLSNIYDGTLLRKLLTTFNRRCLTIWICLKHKMHKKTGSSYIGVIFRVSSNT